MAYLALARKYRPSTFADVVGQEHIVRTLENAIELDRVHHAFLFTGARGVGKTSTARILARCLNCVKGPTVTPCGVCASCTEIVSGTSPDVLEIDGASNTGVDNVRELRETVRYLPSTGRFKVYIIDEVHMLSTAAFNALLKTLEEPPEHVKFIFATTEPQKIPVTILSRCQRFDFRRVSSAVLAEHLRSVLKKEGVGLGAGSVTAVVREAQGSVRDSLSLLDQVLSYVGHDADDAAVIEALGAVDRQTLFELMDAILDRDAQRLLEHVEHVDRRGHDLANIAGLLVEHARDVAVAQVVPEPAASLPERSPDEVDQLRAQAGKLSSTDLHRIFRLLVGVADDVGRSSFPRVSLEMGLLRILELEPTPSVGSLLEKLDRAIKNQGAEGPTEAQAKAPVVAPAGPVEAKPESSHPHARGEKPAAPEPRVDRAPSRPNDDRDNPPRPEARRAPPRDDRNPQAEREAPKVHPDWARFVDGLEDKPGLTVVLQSARPVRFDQEGVELAYESGFCFDKAREKDHKELMGEALNSFFGRVVSYAVKKAGEEHARIANIAERDTHRSQQHDSKVREDALEHPAVKGAVNILGGHVEEVHPLEPSEPG